MIPLFGISERGMLALVIRFSLQSVPFILHFTLIWTLFKKVCSLLNMQHSSDQKCIYSNGSVHLFQMHANFTLHSNNSKLTLVNWIHPNLINFSAPPACGIGFEWGKSPAKINHSDASTHSPGWFIWKRCGPVGRNNASTPSLIMSLIEASIIIKALAGRHY